MVFTTFFLIHIVIKLFNNVDMIIKTNDYSENNLKVKIVIRSVFLCLQVEKKYRKYLKN